MASCAGSFHQPSKVTQSSTQRAASREKSRLSLEDDGTLRVHFFRFYPPFRIWIPEGITE